VRSPEAPKPYCKLPPASDLPARRYGVHDGDDGALVSRHREPRDESDFLSLSLSVCTVAGDGAELWSKWKELSAVALNFYGEYTAAQFLYPELIPISREFVRRSARCARSVTEER
jgi:hypothetical protein